jgi:hypothetical protein
MPNEKSDTSSRSADQFPAPFDLREVRDVLEIEGLHPDDIPLLMSLAKIWATQIQIGAINETTYFSQLQALEVTAKVLAPTFPMYTCSPSEYATRVRHHAFALANARLLQYAWESSKTIDS